MPGGTNYWGRRSLSRRAAIRGGGIGISRVANVNGRHFQLTNPVFQDERVRRAINMGWDRSELDLVRNAGDNQNPEGPYSNAPMPWSSMYDEYPTAVVNGQWYVFDAAQASQLLQAAAYTAENKLKWEHVTWYDRVSSAEVIIPALNANLPEVEVSFRQVDNPTQVTMLSDRNFAETMGIVWGPPSYSMDQWTYARWHTKGSVNYNAPGNAEMDACSTSGAPRRIRRPARRSGPTCRTSSTTRSETSGGRRRWRARPTTTTCSATVRHGIRSTWSCYNSDTLRAVWLDEGHQMQGQ